MYTLIFIVSHCEVFLIEKKLSGIQTFSAPSHNMLKQYILQVATLWKYILVGWHGLGNDFT